MNGKHPVHVTHLVMGLAFLGIAGLWALTDLAGLGEEELRWLLPLPWVLAGLGGLVAWGLSNRGPRQEQPQDKMGG